MKNALAGGLLIVASAALLILLRLLLGPESSRCEHNPSVVLHGTFADCEARNPPPARPTPAPDVVAQR